MPVRGHQIGSGFAGRFALGPSVVLRKALRATGEAALGLRAVLAGLGAGLGSAWGNGAQGLALPSHVGDLIQRVGALVAGVHALGPVVVLSEALHSRILAALALLAALTDRCALLGVFVLLSLRDIFRLDVEVVALGALGAEPGVDADLFRLVLDAALHPALAGVSTWELRINDPRPGFALAFVVAESAATLLARHVVKVAGPTSLVDVVDVLLTNTATLRGSLLQNLRVCVHIPHCAHHL
mmetsp:Transcript_30475/g.65624  ORF Transcript_30475/g.65624 Transcript_30475/m.65624 type:complete len:241 (+) Transcript_30475:1284-2006(+)